MSSTSWVLAAFPHFARLFFSLVLPSAALQVCFSLHPVHQLLTCQVTALPACHTMPWCWPDCLPLVHQASAWGATIATPFLSGDGDFPRQRCFAITIIYCIFVVICVIIAKAFFVQYPSVDRLGMCCATNAIHFQRTNTCPKDCNCKHSTSAHVLTLPVRSIIYSMWAQSKNRSVLPSFQALFVSLVHATKCFYCKFLAMH